jgi:predicted DCC family thiol-disulfide oxidoreductase YuxK
MRHGSINLFVFRMTLKACLRSNIFDIPRFVRRLPIGKRIIRSLRPFLRTLRRRIDDKFNADRYSEQNKDYLYSFHLSRIGAILQ